MLLKRAAHAETREAAEPPIYAEPVAPAAGCEGTGLGAAASAADKTAGSSAPGHGAASMLCPRGLGGDCCCNSP